MRKATKEIIQLALQNDTSVSDNERICVLDALNGKSTEKNEPVVIAEPLLLTMTDAAKFLGVSRVTFWRMVKEEIFQPLEIRPNMFRYAKRDLLDFLSLKRISV